MKCIFHNRIEAVGKTESGLPLCGNCIETWNISDVQKLADEELAVCSNCGQLVNDPSSNYCPHCGTLIET